MLVYRYVYMLAKGAWSYYVEVQANDALALAHGNGIVGETRIEGYARNTIAHAHTAATMAYDFGKEPTTLLGLLKEVTTYDPSNPDPSKAKDAYKDLFNNEIGIKIGRYVNGTLGLSGAAADEAIDDLVMDAYRRGDLIVDHDTDPRVLVSSPVWYGPSSNWQSASSGRDYTNTASGEAILLKVASAPFGETASDWIKDASDWAKGIIPALKDLLPDWSVPAGGIFGDVPAIPILRGWGDPLVLDLDGDGVEVTKMGFGADRSMVYFDMDNDGFAERTAWATGGDGLLALDKNGNGKIDNQGELFGNTNTIADGFLNLKQYDSNADNKITSADAQFANLRVWVDADKDGQTDAGELKTLADLKITQVNLGATILSNVSNNENTVAATSSFVMNGVTKTISEVWFRNDAMDTRYLGDVTLDVRTLFLPTLKGFGNLKDLHVAMSQDAALLTLVQNFTAEWSTKKFENPTALNNEVRSILYKWAGVDTVVDGSRGTFIDAKILSFMEALTGEPYGSNSTLGFTQPSHAVHVPPVMNAFEIAFDSLKAHLLTQAGAGSLFVAAPVYNIASGDLSAGELSLSAINALRTEALTLDSSARGGFWSSVVEYVLNVRDKSSLSTAEANALNSAIVDSGIGQTWESVSNAVLAQYPSSYRATNLSDYVLGGQGNDSLNGLAGDDVIGGLTGNDYFYGGAGNDTYKFSVGDGVDTIYEESGTADTILMGAGITAANIRFEKSTYDLNIYYGTSDKITLSYQFYDDMTGGSSYDEVETLKFSDGSTINLKSGLTFTGTVAADSVTGTNMADTLVGLGGADGLVGYAGDDVLIGGTGNDYFYGGAGNDTYKFSVGDGVDTIYEESGTADTILMGAGITAANIRFEKSTYDLNIYYGTSDKITLSYQFYDDMTGGSSYDEVETLKFSDGSTINLKSGLTFTGTVAADSVTGTNMADTLVGLGGADGLVGYAGDDVLIGGTGNDYFYGGAGNDTYKFSVGDGVDTIYEESGTADTILMGAGITAANIRFEKSTYDLNIYYGTSDKITLSYQFYDDMTGGSSYDEVETLKFSDGSTINLKSGLTFTGTAAADSVTGTNMADTLVGLGGADGLVGYAGDDVLIGGTGNDYFYGGAGNDTYKFSVGDGVDTIYEESGTADTILMGAGITAANIRLENSSNCLYIYYGTSDKIKLVDHFADDMNGTNLYDEVETLKFSDGSTINLKSGLTFTGTVAADSVTGTNMADTLVGLAGDDYLYGGAGNDTLIGGDGNDYMDGGLGVDTASYAGTSAGVTVSLLTTAAQNTVGAGTDTLMGIENLLGSSYNDTLTGDANANTIEGGLGNDTLNGGAGVDTVSYSKATAGVTVDLSLATSQNTVSAGSDLLSNFENIFGSAFADTLKGNSGANVITGGSGNDVINGGAGNDTLYGGLGADSFKFDVSAVGNIDTVKDFKLAEADKLDIRDLLVGYDPLTKAITDFVECTTSGANTIVKVDRDGAGVTYGWQQIAVLENVTGLTDEAALKASGTLIA
jgi:Ca2+-binding RTX toxin-like protein